MKILFTLILNLCFIASFAQGQRVVGTVTEANSGEPLPGVSVLIKGTGNGAITLADGTYQLSNLSANDILIFSFIGMETKEIKVGSQTRIDVVLSANLLELNEVVVTALGISRSRQSLASSVGVIDSKMITDVPVPNLVNSFAGQIAGVQITNGSSGVGSSSRIIIRGENSLTGTNQPLFVVDGVPISNEQVTSDLVNNGSLQEVDYGNGGADIDPDNIESISILKGAGAAALYGSRAGNGVVIINTKRGERKGGIGVTTSSSVTFEKLLTLPEYQNEYGAGVNGEFSFLNGGFDEGISGINDDGRGINSYGPRLDGRLLPQFDSPSVDINGNPVRAGDVIARTFPDGSYTPITATPWIARPDNVRDFFNTGTTFQNNIAINSASESGRIRLAFSNFRNEGILPNTNLDRDGVAISLDQQLNEKLSVTSFINYINTRSDNRPNLGYGYENVMYGFNWTPRQTDIQQLKNYWQEGQVGREHFDYNYVWITNPYFTLFENTNSFDKNRVLGNAAVNYEVNEKFKVTVRTGIDNYTDTRAFRRALSTNRNETGGYREDVVKYDEMNTDILLSYTDRISSDLRFSVSGGANRFNQTIEYKIAEATQLSLPNIFTLANSRAPLIGDNQLFRKRINSVYGTGNLEFKSYLYFDLSLRNDWSSTLPLNDNSFAYYSAGLSFIASEVLNLPSDISYLKLSLSAASSGNDTNPYQLRNTYVFNQTYGDNLKVTNQSTLNNANLRPERLNAYEAGLETYLLNDRLQLEVAAYQNTSTDQIIGRPISQTTGFGNKLENGGKIRTRGLEISLRGAVIESSRLQWVSSVNFSTYRNVLVELPEGVDQFVTGSADIFGGSGGANSVFYIAKEGGRVGDMYGTGFMEVDGRTVYDNNGLPVVDPTLRLLGNYNPDFALGFNNQVTIKRMTIGMLIDWRHGGKIVSRTKALGSTSGVLKETAIGREEGIVGDGVVNVGTAQSPQYAENTTSVSASAYYNAFFSRGNEASALYDASYVKLRQLSVYYGLSPALCQKLGFQSIKVGVIGNNLLLFTENPHVDPELNALQGRNIVYGVEDMSLPSTRSFGFSIKTQF